ncbi:MAG: hypothetical protein F6K30_13835 [Cyanothece sp. SIO2G6]|nr:hypothetical protein [Cyanothece sp. SIO2G6]
MSASCDRPHFLTQGAIAPTPSTQNAIAPSLFTLPTIAPQNSSSKRDRPSRHQPYLHQPDRPITSSSCKPDRPPKSKIPNPKSTHSPHNSPTSSLTPSSTGLWVT